MKFVSVHSRLVCSSTEETIASIGAVWIATTDYERFENELLVANGTGILENGSITLSRTSKVVRVGKEGQAVLPIQTTPILCEPER